MRNWRKWTECVGARIKVCMFDFVRSVFDTTMKVRSNKRWRFLMMCGMVQVCRHN